MQNGTYTHARFSRFVPRIFCDFSCTHTPTILDDVLEHTIIRVRANTTSCARTYLRVCRTNEQHARKGIELLRAIRAREIYTTRIGARMLCMYGTNFYVHANCILRFENSNEFGNVPTMCAGSTRCVWHLDEAVLRLFDVVFIVFYIGNYCKLRGTQVNKLTVKLTKVMHENFFFVWNNKNVRGK